jgi:hypothetical protein
MRPNIAKWLAPFTLAAIVASPGLGQEAPDPAAEIAAQREAMKALAFMDGVWRGEAWTMMPSGEKHYLTQTERIGPFLDGSVKVIEGRGYESDGSVSFNALGIISFDTAKSKYYLRSYAMGMLGDFELELTADGYVWEIPAGPMTMRYTAVIADSLWNEVGDRIMPEGEPVRFFEMNLRRIGDTDWPAADPVPLK